MQRQIDMTQVNGWAWGKISPFEYVYVGDAPLPKADDWRHFPVEPYGAAIIVFPAFKRTVMGAGDGGHPQPFFVRPLQRRLTRAYDTLGNAELVQLHVQARA